MSEQLLEIAKSVILNSYFAVQNLPDFWESIDAGVFVTAYKKLPPTSANVWCCMSNGKYNNPGPLLSNTVESSQICANDDPRIDESENPVAFEITLFAPKHLWIHLGHAPLAITKMRRNLQRAFYIESDSKSKAVYLPDVWNEFKTWTPSDLLTHLAHKAGSDFGRIQAVYEIPCYVIADQTIPISFHDRGFFAMLILERAWNFYNYYKKDNQLAYEITDGNVSYENEEAFVRSYSDVEAYVKLAKLLNTDYNDVLQFALNHFKYDDVASISARIMLIKETEQELDQKYVKDILIHKSDDFAFETPQVVIALCYAYEYFNGRDYLQLRQQIEHYILSYVEDSHKTEAALRQHGAFAANWYLQANAAILQTKWSCLSSNCKKFAESNFLCDMAIDLCKKALIAKRSITEEACAAHGLLISNQSISDYNICENWALKQYEWKQHGGFRYYVEKDWYRTDVTSHVVQVCFLIGTGNRKNTS